MRYSEEAAGAMHRNDVTLETMDCYNCPSRNDGSIIEILVIITSEIKTVMAAKIHV